MFLAVIPFISATTPLLRVVGWVCDEHTPDFGHLLRVDIESAQRVFLANSVIHMVVYLSASAPLRTQCNTQPGFTKTRNISVLEFFIHSILAHCLLAFFSCVNHKTAL